MIAAATVLMFMNTFPICWKDRDDERKPMQIQTIAQAIADASPTVSRAAFLLAISWHESRWCLRVHSGEHLGPGRGLFQMERQESRYSGPFVGLTSNETGNAAQVASRIISKSTNCGSDPASVFTAYAGRPCGTVWKTLRERVQTYQWATWVLTKHARDNS